jgi:hypothetical protein
MALVHSGEGRAAIFHATKKIILLQNMEECESKNGQLIVVVKQSVPCMFDSVMEYRVVQRFM